MSTFEVRLSHTVHGAKKSTNKTAIYLVDAVSCTDAEARVTESVKDTYKAILINSTKRIKIDEIFDEKGGSKYYKCKVVFEEEGRKGKPKFTTYHYLVTADDIDTARDNLHAGMKGTVVDWECQTITETKIIDLIKFKKK